MDSLDARDTAENPFSAVTRSTQQQPLDCLRLWRVLLGDYFARVEQAIPWSENNPLDGRP